MVSAAPTAAIPPADSSNGRCVLPHNQALFSNLGYKNGTLPGILTIVYYAYPIGETAPIVVALFFRDLEGRIYREWRDTFHP